MEDFLFVMNAKWLEKFIVFRLSSKGILASQEIIRLKIEGQYKILSKFSEISHETIDAYFQMLSKTKKYHQLFLIEARFSLMYWNKIRKTHRALSSFQRNPVSKDCLNQLLNIGYYFLRKQIESKCKIFEMPIEIGLLHKARKKKSSPLVYDLMEPWRPILVDYEWIKYFHLKKKLQRELKEKEIAKFVSRLKKRLQKQFYHRELKKCISIEYWMYLYISHFYQCVRKQKTFRYIMPTLRNEMRCNLTKKSECDK